MSALAGSGRAFVAILQLGSKPADRDCPVPEPCVGSTPESRPMNPI
jgi:hypothetical protein